MMWRSALSPSGGDIDPEHEQELRLIAHTRAGAAWALSALVARYQPLVVRYLVRLTGDPRRSHKLAEAIFVRMSRRLRGPHGGDQLRLWLLRASTDAGLDALRRQANRTRSDQLGAPAGPMGLLTGKVNESAIGRLLNAWNARQRPVTTREATPAREFVWQSHAEFDAAGAATGGPDADGEDGMAPRDVLRQHMIRAVLAELPFGDAQCLALHLVAGLNQADVAQALGITLPVAQRRIVQGLQLFGGRYDAALASMGLTSDFDTAIPEQSTTELDATAAPAPVPEPVVDATPSLAVDGARLASPEDVADAAPAYSAASIAGAAPVAALDDSSVPANSTPQTTAPRLDGVDMQAAPEEARAPAVELIAQDPSPIQEPPAELAQNVSDWPTDTGDRLGDDVDLGASFAPEQPIASVAMFDQAVGADETASTATTDRVPDEEPVQPLPPLDEASAAAAPAAQVADAAIADPADAGWAMPHVEPDSVADQIAPEEDWAPPELGGETWASAAPDPAPAAVDMGDDLSREAVPTTPRATGQPEPVETHADVPALTAPDTEDVPEAVVIAVPEAEQVDGASFVAGTAQPVESAALAAETEQPDAVSSALANPTPAEPASEAESAHAALLAEPAIAAGGERVPFMLSSTQTNGEELDDNSDHDDHDDHGDNNDASTALSMGHAQPITATASPEDEEFTLVVEPEPHNTVLTGDTTMAHSLRARRRRVLSADGEAEDPVESTGNWPGS